MKKKTLKNIFKSFATVALASSVLFGVGGFSGSVEKIGDAAAYTTYSVKNRHAYYAERALDESPDSMYAIVKVSTNSTKGGVIVGNTVNVEEGNYDYNCCWWGVDTNGYVHVYWNDGEADFSFTSAGAKINDGVFYHIAVVRTGTAFLLYKDGVLIEEHAVVTTPAISTTYMCIGVDRRSWGNANEKTPFDGWISQVTFYTGAISQRQVRSDCEYAVDAKGNVSVYDRDGISLSNDVDPDDGAHIISHWNLSYSGSWLKERIQNGVPGAPDAVIGSYEDYVASDKDVLTQMLEKDGGQYDYSFAIIPDIQQMSKYAPWRGENQIKWLVTNKNALNLQFAMQLGDLSDNGAREYDYMTAAINMHQMDGIIPYSIVPGNHDYDDAAASRETDYLNKWFPVNTPTEGYTEYYNKSITKSAYNALTADEQASDTYKDKVITSTYGSYYAYELKSLAAGKNPYTKADGTVITSFLPTGAKDMNNGYLGSYEEGKIENTYYEFSAGDVKYLVINLEFYPRVSVLRWASRIIEKYPYHRVIINSHETVSPDGDFTDFVSKGYDTNSPQQAFDYLAKQHANVFMTLGGHHCTDDIARHTDFGENGNKIISMLIDGQVAKDPNDTKVTYKDVGRTWDGANNTNPAIACQDMLAIVFVDEDTKMMKLVYMSPENYMAGEDYLWNIQNQFEFSFADEKNPAIGGVESTVSGKVKNVADGYVGGATVQIKGTNVSATTAQDGSFTLSNVCVDGDMTLVVSKKGYQQSETVVPVGTVKAGETNLGDVNLSHPYAETGVFAASCGNIFGKVGRTLDGIEFIFESDKVVQGTIEIYFDYGETTTAHRNNETSMLRFDIHSNRMFVGTSYKTYGEDTLPTREIGLKLDYETSKNDMDGYKSRLKIPYDVTVDETTYFHLEPTEVIGFSLGQSEYTFIDGVKQSTWSGWSYNGDYIEPEYSTTFMRLSKDNKLFYSANNDSTPIQLSGVVRNEAGDYMKNVIVSVDGGQEATKTDENGFWQLNVGKPNSGDLYISYTADGYYWKSTVETSWMQKYDTYSENVTLGENEKYVYQTLGETTASSSGAVWTGGIALTDSGINFKFTSGQSLVGSIEIMLDFGSASSTLSTGDYKIVVTESNTNIYKDGSASPISNVYKPNSVYTVRKNSKRDIYVSFPYYYFGIEEGDTFGVSFAYNDGTNTYAIKDAYGNSTDSTIAADYMKVSAESGSTVLETRYVELGSHFGTSAFVPYVLRTDTELILKAVSTGTFEGGNNRVHFYIETGTNKGVLTTVDAEGQTTYLNTREAGDFLFNLIHDGTFAGYEYRTSSTNPTQLTSAEMTGAQYNVLRENGKIILYCAIPYSVIGVEKTETVGVTFGQTSPDANGADDYVGYNNSNFVGAYPTVYVKPEIPADYIRIAYDGKNTTAFVGKNNLSAIGKLDDGKTEVFVTRTSTAFVVQVDFVDDFKGDFELWIDTGTSNETTKGDFQIRVNSHGLKLDGTTKDHYYIIWSYRKNDFVLKHSAVDGDLDLGQGEYFSELGATTKNLVIQIPYTVLGINATDTFGFTCGYTEFRQNGNNASAYWGWSTTAFGNSESANGAYVAPEIASDFMRINSNNVIYYKNSNY